MIELKVLVACEESQTLTIKLRELGHEAYSCDIQSCSGGHPEWHIQDDVLKYINLKWDLIVAHPPCTYLSAAGAVRLYSGGFNRDRYEKGVSARDFFMALFNAPCDRVCVENPRPLSIFKLPPCSQIIQPYYFGDPYLKETRLWLKGLSPLRFTNRVVPICSWVSSSNNGLHSSQKMRSKSFPGIAAAMAEQFTGEQYNYQLELVF